MIQITNKENCCGCSSCAQRCPKQCIKMQEDSEGFLYPKVDETSCIDCGLCEKVCPAINPFDKNEPQKFLAAINNNEEVRLQSSSGGIFSILAEKVINEEGVVFGARFDENWQIIIDYTENIEGLSAFRGSKYVQANVGDTYKQCEKFLKDGRKVLYSGTPCQVAGLKHFLRKEYENLITVDFACHGVPSPLVWRLYLEEISNTASKAVDGKSTVLSSLKPMSFIKDISFRDKSEGWKKYRFVLQFNEPNGDVEQSSVLSSNSNISQWFRANIYMRGFLDNMTLRPSCFNCKAKEFRSHSDITVADYWGVKKTMPDIDDDKGVSIVFVNSDRAIAELNSIDCFYKEVTKDQAFVGNPVLYHSAKPWYRRDSFFEQIHNSKSIIGLIEQELKPTFSMKLKKVWYVVKNLSTILRNKIKKQNKETK